MNGSNDQLFEGILQSAQNQASSILKKAQEDAQAVKASYDKKIDDAIEQEKRQTEKRLEQISHHEQSSIRNLKRRHEVSRSERLRQLVMDSVSRKMEALRDTPSYGKVLVGWIAEATIGLDREEAVVSCSFKEHVDEQMLREAEAVVLRAVGRKVRLQKDDKPLIGQGIVVSTPDGKVAYNNQVSTRMLRHERDLKELMEGQQCRKG
jgi:vacuolar-type H+-ATPase subunit E/Vma4